MSTLEIILISLCSVLAFMLRDQLLAYRRLDEALTRYVQELQKFRTETKDAVTQYERELLSAKIEICLMKNVMRKRQELNKFRERN